MNNFLRAAWLSVLVTACAPSVHGAHVAFDLADFVTGDIDTKKVTITPQSTPRADGTTIISSDKKVYTTDSSGMFTASNMVTGNYLCNLAGPYSKTEFRILVPDTNILLNASALLVSTNSVPSENAGYSQAGANALFVLRTNGVAQVLTVTNLAIDPGAGTSNHVFTLTNTVTGEGHWAAAPGAGSGEENTISSLGTESDTLKHIGVGKSGVDLLTRSIAVTNNLRIHSTNSDAIFLDTDTNLLSSLRHEGGWAFVVDDTIVATNIHDYFIEKPGDSVTMTLPNPTNYYREVGGVPMAGEINFWPFGDVAVTLTNAQGLLFERSVLPAIQTNRMFIGSNAVRAVSVKSAWYILQYENGGDDPAGGGGGVADPGANGIMVRTALNTTTARSLAGGDYIHVADPDGVSGNPTLSFTNASGAGAPTLTNAPKISNLDMLTAAEVIGAASTLGLSGNAVGTTTADDLNLQANSSTLMTVQQAGHIVPGIADTQNLGASGNRWRTNYLNGLLASSVSAESVFVLPFGPTNTALVSINGHMIIVTNFADYYPALQYYALGQTNWVLAMDRPPVAADDDYIPKYDAALNKLVWEVDAGAAGGDSITVNGGAVVDPDFIIDTSILPANRVALTPTNSGNNISWQLLLDANHFLRSGSTDSNVLSIVDSVTLTTPTIADFSNATHDHADAAGGGQIAYSDLTGTPDLSVTNAYLPTNGGSQYDVTLREGVTLPKLTPPSTGELDPASGMDWHTNITGNVSLLVTNLAIGQTLTLQVDSDGSHTVNFNLADAAWVLNGGDEPIAKASGTTLYRIWRDIDGTNAVSTEDGIGYLVVSTNTVAGTVGSASNFLFSSTGGLDIFGTNASGVVSLHFDASGVTGSGDGDTQYYFGDAAARLAHETNTYLVGDSEITVSGANSGSSNKFTFAIAAAIARDAEVAAAYQPLDGDLTAVAALTGNGIPAQTAADTWALRTITGDSEIVVADGDGVSGDPTLSIGNAIARTNFPSVHGPVIPTATASRMAVYDANSRLTNNAVTATEAGYLSGVSSAIQTQIDGKEPTDALLTALAALGGNGLIAQTAAGTVANRTIVETGDALVIADGDGVSGNPSLSADAEVEALADLAANGVVTRTAAGTITARTITAGDGITVANGDGVSGNPTVSLTDYYANLYIDAGAMVTNETDGATPGTMEDTDVSDLATFDYHTFADTGSNGVTFKFVADERLIVGDPIKIKLGWMTTNVIATSETVSWEISMKAVSADDQMTNTVFGTAQLIHDDLVSTTSLDNNVTAASGDLTTAITVATGDLLLFKIRRLSQHANDDLNGEARLTGAQIQMHYDSAVVSAW